LWIGLPDVGAWGGQIGRAGVGVRLFFFRKNRMLAEKQKAYRETECLSRNRRLTKIQNVCREMKNTHTQENSIFTRNRNTDRNAE
jgi:hypothetical protein